MQGTLQVVKGILGPIVLFGFVVFIHELGHFLMAKWAGVGVKKFAIGFGPKIFAWVRGETEYSVRWIPLGGFVALKGMIEGIEDEETPPAPESDAAIAEATPGDPPPDGETPPGETKKKEAAPSGPPSADSAKKPKSNITEDLDALRNRSPLVRIAVFGAGVACNYLTAIVFCALLLWYGTPKSQEPPPVLEKVPETSEWYRLGWRSGDRIIAVEAAPLTSLRPLLESVARPENEEEPIDTWSDVWEAADRELSRYVPVPGSATLAFFRRIVARAEDENTTHALWMRVARDGHELLLPWSSNVLERDYETFSPQSPAYVAAFTPNSPAHRARLVTDDFKTGQPILPYPTWEEMPRSSLQPDDRVLGINTGNRPTDMQPVTTWREMTAILRNHPGEPVNIAVKRNEPNQTRNILLTTVLERSDSDPNRGVLGVYPGVPANGGQRERETFLAAVAQAPGMALRLTDQIVYQTADMLTRSWREISRNVGGPVVIGILAYRSAQRGLSDYLRLFAVISIVLAVMNLLPIPVLDGGYILITIIEAIIGRPLPARFLAALLTVFTILFFMLFALIFYNDFMNWVAP